MVHKAVQMWMRDVSTNVMMCVHACAMGYMLGGGGVHRLAPICCNTSMKRLQVKGGQNHAVSVEPAIVVTWDVQRSTKSSSGMVLIVILLYM